MATTVLARASVARPGSLVAAKRSFTTVHRAAANVVTEPDIVLGIGEAAINKFLAAHYKNNPAFYDRGREKNPDSPLYEYVFDDHGTKRRVRFWAKVLKDAGPAVSVDLTQVPAAQRRFAAWWKVMYGKLPTGSETLPSMVRVAIPHAVLQFNFPKLDGSNGEHEIDLSFKIEIQTYLKIAQSVNGYVMQLVDWDITVVPSDDPIDPGNPIWGALKPGCEAEIKRLRLIVRDLFTIGANVALTQLTKTLVATLPLPPIDFVKGVKVTPRALFVAEQAVVLEAGLQRTEAHARFGEAFRGEILRFNEALEGIDLGKVYEKAPIENPAALERYMLKNVPAYKALDDRFRKLKSRAAARAASPKTRANPSSDLFLMLSNAVFDAIAKDILRADKGDCTEWIGIDIGVAYARGRACYWFGLTNAHGALQNTSVSMGCNVKAGGRLDLQACIRIPCAPDECGTWSPGFGLSGPLDLRVALGNYSWSGNRCLKINAQFDNFPGFEVYGLPPVISDIANVVLNFVSSVVLKAFFNAILSALDFYVISFADSVPEAKVDFRLSDFGVSNQNGLLVITGKTTFS